MSSEYKCLASQDGICRNVYGLGIECNGYSEKWKLRPHYKNIQNVFEKAANTIRRAYGIVGDQEE